MPPRRNVPAGLHSELTEYASLLRAIRTTSTQDLVPLLTSDVSWKTLDDDDSTGEDDDSEAEVDELAIDGLEDEVLLEAQAGPSSWGAQDWASQERLAASDDSPSRRERHPMQKRRTETSQERTIASDEQVTPLAKPPGKGKEKATTSRKRKDITGGEGPESSGNAKKKPKRHSSLQKGAENWTWWPLLTEDCPSPEWTFEEEIATIMNQVLRSPSANQSTTSRDVENDITSFSPAYISGLSSDTAGRLSAALSLLAYHRPNATWTKHDRAAPLNWIDVLEAVASAGIFDVSIVESVKRRMEETFAASGSQVVHRMKVRQDANIKLAQAVDEFGGNPSDIGPPTGFYSSTRKADKKGKKKKQSSDED